MDFGEFPETNPSRVCTHSREEPLLARNAKLSQNFFRKDLCQRASLRTQACPLNEEEEGLLPPALPEVPAYKK